MFSLSFVPPLASTCLVWGPLHPPGWACVLGVYVKVEACMQGWGVAGGLCALGIGPAQDMGESWSGAAGQNLPFLGHFWVIFWASPVHVRELEGEITFLDTSQAGRFGNGATVSDDVAILARVLANSGLKWPVQVSVLANLRGGNGKKWEFTGGLGALGIGFLRHAAQDTALSWFDLGLLHCTALLGHFGPLLGHCRCMFQSSKVKQSTLT